MAADSSHCLLTNGQNWERDPFSSLSVTPACDFELLDVKIGKPCLCHGEISSYHPCERYNLVISRAANRRGFFWKIKAYSNRGLKATGSNKKKPAVIIICEMFLPCLYFCWVDSCAIQAWPSPLPSLLALHSLFMCVGLQICKQGGLAPKPPLGYKNPSVSGVWKPRSSP